MSNLDITVKRMPQDGKIKFKDRNTDIELRVATVPTQGNVEDVVMRILAKGTALPLEEMGLTDSNYREFVKLTDKPYGLVLVVGPTGSGKTTTLHAALGHINKPDRKIWTAEDPVEITQRGIRQVQINPRIGFDFATAMRAFLRADPDVIMVGEMRDFETAKMGVEASLTGHLVLSTLHTNSAVETIVRLLDIGIDPVNFADSLLGVLAQRLTKTLCKQCKKSYNPPPEVYEDIANHYGREMFEKLKIGYSKRFILYEPNGCEACNGTGYKGRIAIHELLVKSKNVRKAIQKRESVEDIQKVAMEEGMKTLMQDGILKVLQGNTDMNQILRVCMQVV
jgi:type II secretory ATPase GspE/PulE/Tfp pilus assembly ATPase PilB-like protein